VSVRCNPEYFGEWREREGRGGREEKAFAERRTDKRMREAEGTAPRD